MGRVVYNNIIPEGAGAVGQGFKPERTSPPPLRASSCFASMQSVADLDMACASAPGDHQIILERIKRMGKARAQGNGEVRTKPKRTITLEATRTNGFSTGATVRDREGRKGIIIHANAARTQSGKPVHRIADKRGRSWLAKQSHLTLLH